MNFRKLISFWLYVGIFMVFVQIIVGGITRLTGSGLSITKWEIVTGTLPPFSQAAWQKEFELYKETPQYHKINKDMVLGNSIFEIGSFKFIYFWEYIHRFWARVMGFVFLFPFLFFLAKGALRKELLFDLGIVICFAMLAAIFGWIMVASGLINRPWVNAYKLSIHLSIGFAVFLSLVRATVRYLLGYKKVALEVRSKRYANWVLLIFFLLAIQVFAGGIMSGTKAALFYPTWPDMKGDFFPDILLDVKMWKMSNFVFYEQSLLLVALIQFVHRSLAYCIFFVFSLFGVMIVRKNLHKEGSIKWFWISALLLGVQILLGITVLLTSIGSISVFWGVLHQGVAALLMGAVLVYYYSLTLLRV